MDDVNITHLRGRLNAHRELLIEMMSLIMSDGGRVPAGAQGGPGDDLAVYDQQEDPGVIPTDAYAEQAEFAAEVRAIFDAAQQRMQARKNKA